MLKTIVAPFAGAFLLLAWAAAPAQAQTAVPTVVASCGTATMVAGRGGSPTVDTTGVTCTTGGGGSSGGTPFAPGAAFSTLSVTNVTASVALPAGLVSVFQNTGTTAVSCTLGVGSATATTNQNIIQPSSWLGFTNGANTVGACIDQTGSATNLVVISGGAGIPAGTGGGASSGGGGAVTSIDGGIVTIGAIADAAYIGSGAATVVSALKGIYNTLGLAEAAPGAAVPGLLSAIGVSDGGVSCAGGPCLIAPKALAAGVVGAFSTDVISVQPPWTQTTAIATGTTGAVTATLAIVANKTNYICGFDVSAIGGTAAVSPITITGLLGGTFTYQGVISAATGVNFTRNFGTSGQCIPASGIGVAIAVVTTADGTASAVDVQAWGYYQ